MAATTKIVPEQYLMQQEHPLTKQRKHAIESRRQHANRWIGVDLDGTLARSEGWRGYDHIGEPIDRMVRRVHDWLDEGITVKVLTARVGSPNSVQPAIQRRLIHRWLRLRCNLPSLQIVANKDEDMIELWDDRVVQVVPNTGLRADGEK